MVMCVMNGSAVHTNVQTVMRSNLRPTPLTHRSCGTQKRQVLAKAENPISKVAKDLKEKAQDFNEAITENAKDTAEKTEKAYQEPIPTSENPTDTYRSTELKKSDNKYTPKSDPKK